MKNDEDVFIPITIIFRFLLSVGVSVKAPKLRSLNFAFGIFYSELNICKSIHAAHFA